MIKTNVDPRFFLKYQIITRNAFELLSFLIDYCVSLLSILQYEILNMGIQGLMNFLKSKAPNSINQRALSTYHNQTLTIDASNWIYQFMVKTQSISQGKVVMPVDWMGNRTGHLIGILARIQLCFNNKITPVWVFDGKPPEQKIMQLRKRKKNKQQAEQKAEQAIEEGQVFDLLKMSKRSVRITDKEKQDAIKMIQLIGLPTIQSQSEAEPQCASIVKQGFAYGTLSEDLDTLTFGCPKMIRSFSSALPHTTEIELDIVLSELGINYDQFIDFCILCGCDYTSKIKGIGPVKGHEMIVKYGNIEKILQVLINDEKLSKKHTIPDDFNHLRARKLFKEPTVHKVSLQQVSRKEFRRQQFIDFLTEKQFSTPRIQNWLNRNEKTGMLK